MSYALRQNPAHPNNYTPGRQGVAVNKLVIHHAATTDFNGIARTFQNPGRSASAHYGVGRNNNVDQYVQEGNIAWHCGNWPGNQSSIGIENVNDGGAPNWPVGEATFNTLVELCRDIAARHGLGKLVVGKNLFGHKDFSATACPADLYGKLQRLADAVNGGISGGAVPVPSAPRKSNETLAAEVLAGAWGNNPDRKNRLEAAGYNYAAIQAIVNGQVGGSAPAPQPARPSVDTVAQQVIAGAWGNGPERQARLQAAGYSYSEVQNAVNRMLGIGAAPNRKSNDQIANEVLAGMWGNNPQRAQKLAAAGYDANAIQSLVNRKLGY